MKLFIGMPIHSKPTAHTLVSMTNLAFDLSQSNEFDVHFHPPLFCSNLPFIRNVLLHEAAEWGSDLLLFVDDDMLFQPRHVRLLFDAVKEEGVDIVAATYVKKMPGEINVARPVHNGERRGSLIECELIGMGLTLLTSKAMKTLLETYASNRFVDHGSNQSIVGIFEKMVVQDEGSGIKRFLGEDEVFCNRWRSLGHKIWLHHDCQIGHIGQFIYQNTPEERQS